MNPFSYATPRTVESAIDLASERTRYLAGGMDLLGELKEGLVEPSTLVNIKALPGTHDITTGSQGWSIGANVTLSALAEHQGIRETYPGLAQAALEVGSPQIRNRGTVGGNLAQHSRCWYYRQRDAVCRKKGGSTCLARAGENKFHCLFTRCMCISPLVSNLAVALAALDAVAVVRRGRKEERLSMAEFYATAMRTPSAHNSLRPGDLVLRVEIPVVARQRSAYLQLMEKGDFDWALVSCAVSAVVTDGVLSRVRLVLGCVAPIPWSVEAANRTLEGRNFSEEVAGRACDLLLKDASPYTHNGYKVPVARALIIRALRAATGTTA